MTKSAQPTSSIHSPSHAQLNQSRAQNAETESLRLKQEDEQRSQQEQSSQASFEDTYSALKSLLKIKQTKYQKTLKLAFLEGQISLQAIVVFAILLLLICIFLTALWCLIMVAVVLTVVHFFSALWLGLLTAAVLNVLLIAIFFMLLKRVKHEVGFSRTKRVLAGDL